jgi:hypothetical protein
VSAGAEILDRFVWAGYELVLEDGKIKASGPTDPPEELRDLVEKNRGGLKAALLLADPPGWLEKQLELWWKGTETSVTRTNPATGRAEVYKVRVTVREICAAVAAKIGLDPLEWHTIREEVEERLALRRAVQDGVGHERALHPQEDR